LAIHNYKYEIVRIKWTKKRYQTGKKGTKVNRKQSGLARLFLQKKHLHQQLKAAGIWRKKKKRRRGED